MTSALLVQPDQEFIREIRRNCGGDLKKCYQCATCSSACSQSTESRPFPRKQILEAQWGMGNQLIGDPAIWLCHDCGDCTARCPRGTRPAAVMDAIRLAVMRRLAFPRFLGNMIGRSENGAVMFVFSALVLLTLAKLPVHGSGTGPLIFAQMFPKTRLEPFFFAVGAYVLLALTVGAVRFAKALRSAGVNSPILSALPPVLLEIISHRRFADCGAGQNRRWGHLSVLSGFLGLALMGTIVGIGCMIGILDTPLPNLYPLKIFANCCALALVSGVAILFWNRVTNQEKRTGSSFCDWYFLFFLGGTGLTGILSETMRLAQNADWMFAIYYLHLSLVLTLFLCTPYSKFVHFLYRTMAMAATWQESKSPRRALLGAHGSDAMHPLDPTFTASSE